MLEKTRNDRSIPPGITGFIALQGFMLRKLVKMID